MLMHRTKLYYSVVTATKYGFTVTTIEYNAMYTNRDIQFLDENKRTCRLNLKTIDQFIANPDSKHSKMSYGVYYLGSNNKADNIRRMKQMLVYKIDKILDELNMYKKNCVDD